MRLVCAEFGLPVKIGSASAKMKTFLSVMIPQSSLHFSDDTECACGRLLG